MKILIISLFIIITILSIILFKTKGLFILIITIPLIIMYFKLNIIIDIFKRKNKVKSDKIYISERKEVEIVGSKNRRNNVKEDKKRKVVKKKTTSSRNKKDKNNNKNKKSILRKILTILLGFAIFCVFIASAFLIYIVVSTGDFNPEALKNQDQTIIYDKNGEVIAKLGDEKRESVTYEDLPQVLVDAIVATEDSRFYQHNGVDMARFLKASFYQLLGQDDAGGASTLTMQVVKNNLTNTESSGLAGIIRKFKDVYLSVFFMEKKI